MHAVFQSEVAEEDGDKPYIFMFPRAHYLYHNTVLKSKDIASLLDIPFAALSRWIEKGSWQKPSLTGNSKQNEAILRSLETNTAKALIKYSASIAEQIEHIGRILLEQSMRILNQNDSEIAPKDKLNFAIRFKELEAKIKGQIKAPSVNIQVNQNNVYRDWIENKDQMFDEAETAAAEELPQPERITQLPEDIAAKIPEQKEKFTLLSDKEVEELLND